MTTIKDIARESGYSVGTVSRVLNDRGNVSNEARRVIMEVVKRNHFRLNENARLLKRQTKRGIAILVKGYQNRFFGDVLEQIQGEIEKKEYDVSLYYIGEDDDEVEAAIRICRERKPRGILFLGSNLANFREDFNEIDIPCVLVTNDGKELNFPNLSSVSTDDEAAGFFAVEQLISMGHRNIGILGGMISSVNAAHERNTGAMRAFAQYGIPFDPKIQYEESYFTIQAGYRAMNRLMQKMPDMTALFAMSDVMAMGAIRAVRDQGKSVPEDISVFGFDGIDLCDYYIPRLTTIRQNREAIASRSIEILLDAIENEAPSVHELEPFQMLPGESVKRLG